MPIILTTTRTVYNEATGQYEFIEVPYDDESFSAAREGFGSSAAFETSAEQVSVRSAWLQPVKRVYGEQRVVGDLAWMSLTGNYLRVVYVFCDGPCEDITKIWFDGVEVDVSGSSFVAGTTYTNSVLGTGGRFAFYLGTGAQDVSACTIGSAVTWTPDTYASGVQFVAVACEFRIVSDRGDPAYALSGFPRVEILLQGRNDVEDPRASPSAGYTATPVLCAGHWLTNDYDSGTTIDATSFDAAADRQETTLDGKQRHTWAMILGQQSRPKTEMLALIEEWSNCRYHLDGTTWYAVPDEPYSGDIASITDLHTLSVDGGDRISDVTVRRVGGRDKPDDVRVRWFDKDTNQQRVASALGNVNGTFAELSMPHIGDYSEAERAAIKARNRRVNEDILVDFTIRGADALRMLPGDMVNFTSSVDGLSSFSARIVRSTLVSPCEARVSIQEYQSGTYSNSIASDPITSVGAPTDKPGNPPTLANLAGTATAIGRQAEIALTWDDPEYPFLYQVRVRVYDSAPSPDELLLEMETPGTTGTTITGLPAGIDFTVQAEIISIVGAVGLAASVAVSKPTLPTLANPSNARVKAIAPVMIGDQDGMRVQVLWDDPDFRAWAGYRLKVFEYAKGAPAASPAATYDFSHGGAGVADIPIAPSPYSALSSWTRFYYFTLHTVNADGLESTGVVLEQPIDGSLPGPRMEDYGRFSIGEEMADSAVADTFTGEWREVSDDGSGNIVVSFGITYTDTTLNSRPAGAYITAYECDSGGSITGASTKVFVPAGLMKMIDSSIDPATYSQPADAYGMITHAPSFAANESLAPTMTLRGNGSTYYRYTVQMVGPGQQATDEVDMTEFGVSPDNTVHGPI